MCLFVCLFFIHSSIHLFICSFILSFMFFHSFSHSFIYSLIHSFIHLSSIFCVSYKVVQPQALESHLSSVHCRISERERRFMSYARQWWKAYISGHQSHSRQQVKIFAQNECGTSKPVVSYITPIHTGWLLDSPQHAAQFVSLLKHEEECSMFGSKVDTWSSLHAFLCRGKGVRCWDIQCMIIVSFRNLSL
jgi:centrosomal protein CEP76